MENIISTTEPRKKINLNREWTFMYGDIQEAQTETFDDSQWYHIVIPHSFGIPYFMENHFYVGYGCYRRALNIKKEWIGKKILIEFQGVFQEAEIYINGIYVDKHQGGYTAFVVDISNHIREGINSCFVRVNNNWNPRLAPRAGEHTFQGGIYRDVSMIITEPVHISWYGTFVKTSNVTVDMADLVISTEIENYTNENIKVTLNSTVIFEDEIVALITDTYVIDSNRAMEVVQKKQIANPRLWHPDTPHLYTLKSDLYIDDTRYDVYETTFGIRWFSFDASKGFYLNGEHYNIVGANVHQDHAGWGDAVTHAGIHRDVKLIKDCGMNFIRGSHYPHHTVFADECDRQGILFWSELCFWGIGGSKGDGYWNSSAYPIHEEDEQEFEESCIRALNEMIRTNRNHPSIIVWSMSNEVFFSKKEVLNKARELVKRLVKESHKLDPTRPAASGGAQREGFDLLGDLAGYNGDGAKLYMNPGFPSFVSEYGSRISDRPGEYSPNYTDGVEVDYPWRSGKALWCGFHHGSIADHMGHMGFIDYYRLPLQSYYWYRNELLGIKPPETLYSGIPYGLKLSSDKSTIRTDGTDDALLKLEVVDKFGVRINNSMKVILEVSQGGALFPTGKQMELSPDKENLIEGLGAIEIRAFYAGEITIIAKAEGLLSDSITMLAIGEEKWNGQKLNLPTAPPSVYIPKETNEQTNIARNKPVFSSSYKIANPPNMINDEDLNTYWSAIKDIQEQWIQIDLEGVKKVNKINVKFCNNSGRVELLVSNDGISYELLSSRFVDSNNDISITLVKQSFRYVKLCFRERAVDVAEIEVF